MKNNIITKFDKEPQIIEYSELIKKVKMPYLEGDDGYKSHNHKVAYFDSDVSLSSLSLNGNGVPYSMIYIAGNLNVEKDIINSYGHTGLNLIVAGNVNARHIIAENSEIVFEGTTNLSGICFAYYNDGVLSLNKIFTHLLITDEHHTTIEDKDSIEHYWDSLGDYGEFQEAIKLYISDELLEDICEEGEEDTCFALDSDKLVEFLIEDKSIFKKELSSEKDYK